LGHHPPDAVKKPTKTKQIQKLFVSLRQNSMTMYSLKEFWQLRNLPFPEGEWDKQ
jgi:hypothetical protein